METGDMISQFITLAIEMVKKVVEWLQSLPAMLGLKPPASYLLLGAIVLFSLYALAETVRKIFLIGGIIALILFILQLFFSIF